MVKHRDLSPDWGPLWPRRLRRAALAALTLVAVGCSEDNEQQQKQPTAPTGPFQSLAPAANAPASFSQPRAGVPLPAGGVAFLATVEGRDNDEIDGSGERVAVFIAESDGVAPRVLYTGDKIVNPFDIAVSVDGNTLYIADVAAGSSGDGAIVTLPVAGGEPTEQLQGFAPRGVTIADNGTTYFSGTDPESGEPGVFVLSGSTATTLFAGAPLVDPSGIAVAQDGRVFVVDTRLFDTASARSESLISSEAGIVRIENSAATIFATGFATGYPAGLALTLDDATLIVSGQGPDRSDTVYLVNVANPSQPPTAVRDSFSEFQDSSAGLKRAHRENTFVWASLSANGGTLYRIRGH